MEREALLAEMGVAVREDGEPWASSLQRRLRTW